MALALHQSIREIENCYITLSDGCRLATKIWLPIDAETHPVPAILEYLPYRKRDGTAIRDQLTHPYFAAHRYAAIRVDMRGCGESDGLLEDEYTQQEQDDCLEVLHWIADQTWCTGKIGMMGISWGGFNSLQVAALRPPELAAIISLCSTDDRYADDIHYMDGCLLNDNLQWSSIMLAYMSRSPDKALVGEKWRDIWLDRLQHQPLLISNWLQHQHRDDYWKHGSICENWDAITCPVYLIGGWDDGYASTISRMLMNLQCERKGLIGPWAHHYPHFAKTGPQIGFLQEALRWWDKWLKGIETGIMHEPMYRVWMEEPSPPLPSSKMQPGRWIAEKIWPSENITPLILMLNADAKLSVTPEAEQIIKGCSPQSVGETAGAWCGFGLGPEKPADQRIDDDRSLYFDSEPLTERIEIFGAPIVTLHLTVDRPTAFVSVRLNEIMTDGASTRISYGLLNLTHRNSHSKSEPIIPGERIFINVQLNDIAHAFAIGSRIRISISTTYWPLVFPSPEPVTLSIYTGISQLSLPIRKPHESDNQLRTFDDPKTSPALNVTHKRPASGRRWIERDIESGIISYFIEEDSGHSVIEHLNLETDMIRREVYRIHDDDPLSATIEITCMASVNRDEWQTRTETRTTMRADKTHFILEADLVAYESDILILSRQWEDRIARDGI